MKHKCNLCGKEMRQVDDIEIKGIRELTEKTVRGYRCTCGNEHSNPDDVNILVKLNNEGVPTPARVSR